MPKTSAVAGKSASSKSSARKASTKTSSLTRPDALNNPRGATTDDTQALISVSRQPGSKQTTAVGGPGPQSPTDNEGNYKGKPGEDIQARPALAPTETRNTVRAAGNTKPETNVSRADTKGMAKLTPEASNENFDIRAVPPTNIDAENVKILAQTQKESDKVFADQDKARRSADSRR